MRSFHVQQAPQTARILLPGVPSPSQVLPVYLQAQRQQQQQVKHLMLGYQQAHNVHLCFAM
jgi:hypothetical protein